MELFDLVNEFRDEVRDSDITWWDDYLGCTIYIPRINDRDYYKVVNFADELRDMGHKVDLMQNLDDDYDELESVEMDVYPY